MAHTIRHRLANRSRCSRLKIRRLRLWLVLHAQVCECCGLALWGRRYTNAALQRVCRDCFLAGPVHVREHSVAQFITSVLSHRKGE